MKEEIEEIIKRNRISISEEERELLSDFVGENLQWAYVDWSRLMPVVEKIEALNHRVPIELRGCCVTAPYGTCGNDDTDKSGDFILIPYYSSSVSKISAAWTIVVDFIKWYNTSKK